MFYGTIFKNFNIFKKIVTKVYALQIKLIIEYKYYNLNLHTLIYFEK